jgi:glycosyltransferase domain-containing protein
LVIPTFNRPEHLSRLLSYYAGKDPKFSILVLDSSEPAIQSANAELLHRFKGKARHMSFPGTIPVAGKLAEGLQQVATPYAALCADDDLMFVSGLASALAYLGEHPECVCVDGIYLNFNKVGHDLQVKIEYASRGIEADHPCARVFRLFQRYESLFYGVFRMPDLQHIFSGVSRVPSLHFQELFQSTAALLKGNSHRLPIFYAGRQHCEAAEPTRDKWQTYYWFAENPVEFLQHYAAYREDLLAYYKQYGAGPHLSDGEFIKAMDLAHTTFFCTNCPPEYFFNVLKPLWPDESFNRIRDADDDISVELKALGRRQWESRLRHAANVLIKRVKTWHSKGELENLNREARNEGGTAWNCVLPEDLKWLSGVDAFRRAYVELCDYMDGSWRALDARQRFGDCGMTRGSRKA